MGVIYVATGKDHAEAATRSALSVRSTNPHLGLAIFTDQQSGAPFDLVIPVKNAHARSKVDYMAETPFARTVYLDGDTRAVGDITSGFALLDRFDIAIAHAHARGGTRQNLNWRTEVPQCFPQMNSGVMYYRSTPEVLEFMRTWGRNFHEAGFKWDQVTLRELVWQSNLQVYILPPEYNIRDRKYLKTWTPDEAQPRILHFAEFHAAENSARGAWLKAANLLKRVSRRLRRV